MDSNPIKMIRRITLFIFLYSQLINNSSCISKLDESNPVSICSETINFKELRVSKHEWDDDALYKELDSNYI